MDVVALIDLPIKTAGLGDVARNFLIGAKHIPKGELDYMRRLVTESGFAHSVPTKGFLDGARSLLFGGSADPVGVFKARMRQGGMFGKGGIIRGDMAFNPDMFDKVRDIRRGEHTFRNYKDVAAHGLGGATNLAFGAGLPLAALGAAVAGKGSYSDAGAESASLVGYSLGAPFGIVGGLAGGALGSIAGDRFRKNPAMVPPEVALPARAAAQQMMRFEAPEPQINLSNYAQ